MSVDIAFFAVAFLSVLVAMFRSLGWGFLAVTAVGYLSGVIRANYLGVFTTFMFDAALFGLYLGFLLGRSHWEKGAVWGPITGFVAFLIAWPTLLCFIPINHFLIQCVGLRAAVWFLPVLLLAARLKTGDLTLIARGMVVLNLVAFAFGIYIYFYGVESLYPLNPVTEIIYKSSDIASSKYHRIPASFLSAHAYGGTMLATLPFLLDRLVGVKVRLFDRWFAVAGVVAAFGGLLMCGARLPLVLLTVSLVIAWVLMRLSLKLVLVIGLACWIGLAVARNNERFQRATTLADAESVSQRIGGSLHSSLFELIIYHPMGTGLGSAAGTSVPFFLRHLAPEQIGLENEYSRILLEQGWFGLAGWLAFLGWLFLRPPPARPAALWRFGVVFMYALTLTQWTTAFIGTGLLTSIPQTFLMLTQMGVLVAVRNQGAVPESVTRRAQAEFGEDVETGSGVAIQSHTPWSMIEVNRAAPQLGPRTLI